MQNYISLVLAASIAGGGLVGCESMGGKQTSGTVIGGAAGAAAGALVAGEDNRLLGALIGGALGAAGGNLIGSELKDKDQQTQEEAIQASQRAEASPATAEQARLATTADVNSDGYVTLDEVVAMEKAGLSDDQIIARLDQTEMFFDLSAQQKQQLRDQGVSDGVIDAMQTVNPEIRRRAEEELGVGKPIGRQS